MTDEDDGVASMDGVRRQQGRRALGPGGFDTVDEERRRRKAAVAGMERVVAAVSLALFRDDPVGLDLGMNQDEYDPEAESITAALPRAVGPWDVLAITHSTFVRAFGRRIAGPRRRYRGVAEEIWRIWSERGRADHGPADSRRTVASAGFTTAPDPALFWSAWQLGAAVDPAELPALAVTWLEQGLDAQPIAYLAGMSRADDPRALEERLAAVADELDAGSIEEADGRVRAAMRVLEAIRDGAVAPVAAAGWLANLDDRCRERNRGRLARPDFEVLLKLFSLRDEVEAAELDTDIRSEAQRLLDSP